MPPNLFPRPCQQPQTLTDGGCGAATFAERNSELSLAINAVTAINKSLNNFIKISPITLHRLMFGHALHHFTQDART